MLINLRDIPLASMDREKKNQPTKEISPVFQVILFNKLITTAQLIFIIHKLKNYFKFTTKRLHSHSGTLEK